jgi:uncharacterized protein YecE (DUF72 family)
LKLYVGTSGWSYPAWKGSFYPEDLSAKEMLAFYAGRLPAVEINNTFYRMPKSEVLAAWRAQAGDEFRFALKAPQRITHQKRLREAGEETAYFLRTAETLGEALGPVLFQLPPNFKIDVPRLESFLDVVAEEQPATRAAFEFRHPSWRDGEALAALRARGCAWCAADTDEEPVEEIASTAPWGYLRLRRDRLYDDEELAGWVARVRAQGWDEAYVFFKHEDEGAGPRLAARFRELFLAAGAERPGA